VTVQVGAVPVQAPLQPVKIDPDAACAVSVTDVPGAKSVEHTTPQAIPSGLEVTVPVPSPTRETESGNPDPPPKSTTLPTKSAPVLLHAVVVHVSSQVTRNLPRVSGTTYG
jgi:hypothetical protein